MKVDILSGSRQYSITNSNPDVVSAYLSYTSISLEGISTGSSIVKVTDVVTNQSAEIIITVIDKQANISCPDNNHPHAIDLGLPSGTTWACCNLTDDPIEQSPIKYGGYYAWGEMQSKEIYEWEKYSFCKGSFETCQDIGNDIAGTEYDVANLKSNGSWVLPSKEQIAEIVNNCTYQYTHINKIPGGRFTGKNGKSIFLPAAGHSHDSNIWGEITTGYYWSSTMNVSTYNDKPYLDEAFCLYFNHAGSVGLESGLRCTGNYIRPVSK